MTIVLEEERLEQAVLADSAGGVVASIVVGARPNARRVQGDTFLHLAAGAGAAAAAATLLEQGADAGALDKWGRTPLHIACGVGDEVMVGLLLEQGLPCADEEGRTPLHVAASEGHAALVPAIVGAAGSGAADLQDKAGYTALHCAADAGHTHCVRALLDAGADASVANHVGNTALRACAAGPCVGGGGFIAASADRAARHGHTDAVRSLVQGGAEVAARNDRGDVAVEMALAAGHSETVALLRAAEAAPGRAADAGYRELA